MRVAQNEGVIIRGMERKRCCWEGWSVGMRRAKVRDCGRRGAEKIGIACRGVRRRWRRSIDVSMAGYRELER